MFRHSLRRCARQAGSLPSATILLRPRAALPTLRHVASSASRPSLFSSILNFSSRSYSSEAVAEQPASPSEISRFEELSSLGVHPNLISAITDGLGYDTMTEVQAKTINPALKGTDIVAQAKTGTGKTLAFLLPLFQRMIDEDPSLAQKKATWSARSDDIRGIVLSPTRELAEQIAAEAKRLASKTGLVVQVAVGGTNRNQMLYKTQKEGCHLMVATPGRLNDLLQDEATGIDAPKLASLVLDEADRILDVGFERQVQEILERLPKNQEKVRQTLLVSATIPDDVIRLARTLVRPEDFQFVQTIPEHESLTHDRVPQHLVVVPEWANIFPTLFELIDREAATLAETPGASPFKAIVYFNYTFMTALGGELGWQRKRGKHSDMPTWCIQSGLSQFQRTQAANQFRNTKTGVLFSSDVTARGMDFPDVTHVIQIDVPRERETYIHRVGRTARQGKDGQSWLLLPGPNVSQARRLLKGLPLAPNTTLQSAEYTFDGGELPLHHEQTRTLARKVHSQIVSDMYKVTISSANGDPETIDQVNRMMTDGFGLDELPRVPPSFAMKNGGAQNFNVSDRFSEDRGDDRRGRGGFERRGGGFEQRGGGFGGRGGGRDGFDRQRRSDDPFQNMRSDIRRDDGGNARRGGGGGRYGRDARW